MLGRELIGITALLAIRAIADSAHAAAHNVLDAAKLLGQFAALKTEFGLTDRYRIEGWRAGRE